MKNRSENVKENPAQSKDRVPRLRFPEFRDEGKWQHFYGNELFDAVVDKDHSSDLPILTISQEYGAVPRDVIDYNVVVTEKSIESYKVVEIGDFIISLRSFQGGIEYSEYKGICSPAYIILRKKNESVQNHFFRYYFKSNKLIKALNKNIEGIRDGKMVSYAQFSELNLPFPGPKEQQKIAACLSSLDTLIAAHGKKLESLKAFKKGLMQRLFPAEGERVPRLRFPGFKGEWEEKCFSQFILKMNSGVSVNSFDRPVSKNKEIGVLKTSCVSNGQFISEENKVVKESESNRVQINPKRNTIIMSRMNTPLLVGESGYISKDYPDLFLPDRLWLIECDENLVLTIFFSQFLSSDKMKVILRHIATGTSNSMKNISQPTLLSQALSSPSLPEQQKIASALSFLDSLIAAQARKIEELKEYKRGLMQGLFPEMDDEVYAP